MEKEMEKCTESMKSIKLSDDVTNPTDTKERRYTKKNNKNKIKHEMKNGSTKNEQVDRVYIDNPTKIYDLSGFDLKFDSDDEKPQIIEIHDRNKRR